MNTNKKLTNKKISKINNQKDYIKILNKYEQKLNYLLNHHSRVIQKRFDLHYPDDNSIEPSEEHIYKFTEYFTQDLKRNNPLPPAGKVRSEGRQGQVPKHPMDPQIMSVREQSTVSSHPHYHILA
jgi:hypothetical protein